MNNSLIKQGNSTLISEKEEAMDLEENRVQYNKSKNMVFIVTKSDGIDAQAPQNQEADDQNGFLHDPLGTHENEMKCVQETNKTLEAKTLSITPTDAADGQCCPFCQKCFKKTNFRPHIIIDHHSNDLHMICRLCEKTFQSSTELMKHLETHLQCTKYGYKCKTCLMIIGNVHQYRKHLFVHKGYNNGSQYECQCGILCDTIEQFRCHLLLLHKGEKSFLCLLCKKNFLLKTYFTQHVQYHTKCFYCNKEHESRHKMKHHVINSHHGLPFDPTDGQLLCTVCKMVFNNVEDLQKHASVHSRQNEQDIPLDYFCTLCTKDFENKKAFSAHKKMHPEELREPLLSCWMCSREFFDNDEEKFNEHLREHSEYKANGASGFICTHCGWNFALMDLYKVHLKIHFKKDKKDMPPKLFKEKIDNLISYQSVQHTTKSVYCVNCKESFRTTFDYQHHLKNHVKCFHCAKNCSTREALLNHVGKLHKGLPVDISNQPLLCTLCRKYYNDLVSLKKHIAEVHKDETCKRKGEPINHTVTAPDPPKLEPIEEQTKTEPKTVKGKKSKKQKRKRK